MIFAIEAIERTVLSGGEEPSNSLENEALFKNSTARVAAPSQVSGNELQELASAWGKLPAAIREGLNAMTRASVK